MNVFFLRTWNWTKSALDNSIGVLLTAMFVAVLFLVVSILAALQFRDNIQNSTITPKPNAGHVRQGVSTLEWRKNVQDDLGVLEGKRQDVDDKLFAMQQDVYTGVRTAIQEFSDPKLGALPFPLDNDSDATNYYKIREVYSHYRTGALVAIDLNADARFRDNAKKKIASISADVNRRLSGYNALLEADSSVYFKIDKDQKTLEQIDGILNGQNAGAQQQGESFRDLCEELLTYKSVFGRMAYEMIFMPKSSLTLMLAVVMGLLGSLIYLARERVVDQTRVGLSVIVFRASLGGALAVAIYVFAAAGMVAIGQHSANSDAAEMSPYLISFIGITAGYLSEHMAAWMAQVGRDTFKVDGVEAKERWTPHLSAQLGSKTAATIAQALNVPQSQVDSWIAVSAPVPSEHQSLLAVHLGLDVSDVFTDIPPRTHRQT